MALDLRLAGIDGHAIAPTKRCWRSTNGMFAFARRPGHKGAMAIAFVFLLGIANFALHRAVLDSRHGVVQAIMGSGPAAARVTLGLEFVLLLVAMLATAASASWAWAYALYSAGNALAAWAILTRRI